MSAEPKPWLPGLPKPQVPESSTTSSLAQGPPAACSRIVCQRECLGARAAARSRRPDTMAIRRSRRRASGCRSSDRNSTGDMPPSRNPACRIDASRFRAARCIGGSSAINAMTFIRGHQFCFDRWERAGNPGWGYEALLPYFKKSERNEMGETPYRGGDGPLAVSMCTDPHAGHRAFLAAVAQQQFKVDARYDFNHADAGQCRRLLPEEHPRREAPQRRRRVPDAGAVAPESRSAIAMPGHEDRVRRQESRRHRIPARRQARTARAGDEIVLSRRRHRFAEAADALGNRSGRSSEGARHSRRRRRARRRQELPGSPEVVDSLDRQDRVARLYGDGRHVRAIRSGQFRRPARPAVLRRPRCRNARSIHHHHRVAGVPEVSRRDRAALGRSARGADNSRQLSPGAGRRECLGHAASSSRAGLARRTSYADLKGEEILPGPQTKSDADLAAFVRRDSDTIYHGAGTCKMGPASDPTAVVDPSLRVRGVDGLRVADGSIMPEVVNATTNAACVMIGEKASDLVRNA